MYKITTLNNESQQHIAKVSNRIRAGLKAYSLCRWITIKIEPIDTLCSSAVLKFN